LPCSELMMAASSAVCSLTSSRNANMTEARLTSDVSRQAGNAALAAATAASTSAAEAKSTVPDTCPVAGL
jgi:hypothetical protein